MGVARQGTDEERTWWDLAKEAGRANVKGEIGVIEGVTQEGGQIIDTLLWARGKYTDLTDEAIDAIGEGPGWSEEEREVAKALNDREFKAMRQMAADAGMVDKDTGAITVSGMITEGFNKLDKGLDETVFEGMRPEDTFFTARDIGQLEGAIEDRRSDSASWVSRRYSSPSRW